MAPQRWILVNVDQKQLDSESPVGYNVPLRQWFFDSHAELYRSLTLPRLPEEYKTWCTAPPGRALQQPHSARLLSIPPELLHRLFDTIDAMALGWHTAVALATACKLLLQIARPHIRRGMRVVHAPWAGCRLVCVGERTRDLPPGMLSDEEEQEIRAWTPSGDAAPVAVDFLCFIGGNYRLVFGWVWESRIHSAGSALLDKIEAAAPSSSLLLHPDVGSRDILDTVRSRETGGADIEADTERQRLLGVSIEHSTRGDAHRFRELYGTSADFPGPGKTSMAADTGPATDRVRVLCNFVAREYVRENALTVARGRGARVTWGHILLSKICWSSDTHTGMTSGQSAGIRALHRGAWSGGRFCITTLDSLPEAEVEMGFVAWGEGGRGWRDVSAEANELLTDLFDEPGYVRKEGSDGQRSDMRSWNVWCPED
ncbi:hypothetical protein C8Q74DRAFT_1373185 [Fomes fomentarius]|nr:hypothetical protein C8Q74DRAFT_1373185 [Fomes fomentarius]